MITDMGIKASCTPTARVPGWATPETWDGTSWTVRMRYGKHSMTFPFYLGAGINQPGEPPSIQQLMASMKVEVELISGRNFLEWCIYLGYDLEKPGERRTHQLVYLAQLERVKRIRRLFGGDFDEIIGRDW